MAITTYSELQDAIAKWLIRTDLTVRIPDFISLCEATMQRLLTTADMESSTTLSTTASSPLVALPTGFNGVRRLRILLSNYYSDVQIVSLEPSLYDGIEPAPPVVASIVGSNLYLKPIPDGVYSMPLDYYAKFTPLSTSATSNWILTKHPDAYLYGSLLQSAPFLNDSRLPIWRDGFKEVIDQINGDDKRVRFGQMKLRVDPALSSMRRYAGWRGWC